MMPTLSRAALNNADDIIREAGLTKFGAPAIQKGRGNEAAQCVGKTGFETYRAAQIIARKGHGISTYRCRFCRMWHVGGMSGRRNV